MAESTDEDAFKGNIMASFLKTPGLAKKDVMTMLLDILFAGIDTVRFSK